MAAIPNRPWVMVDVMFSMRNISSDIVWFLSHQDDYNAWWKTSIKNQIDIILERLMRLY